MTREIHPLASLGRSMPDRQSGERIVVLRSESADPGQVLTADAIRHAGPIVHCRDVRSMMLALDTWSVRLLFIDAGSPGRGLHDPSPSVLATLTSPHRDVPRVLVSHDAADALERWRPADTWFREILRGPVDGPAMVAALAAHARDH